MLGPARACLAHPPSAPRRTNMYAYYRDFSGNVLALRDLELTKRLCGGSTVSARAWAAQHKEQLLQLGQVGSDR